LCYRPPAPPIICSDAQSLGDTTWARNGNILSDMEHWQWISPKVQTHQTYLRPTIHRLVDEESSALALLVHRACAVIMQLHRIQDGNRHI
jgi:hypothetical protein